jgi:DNA polymerase III subunit delta
MITVLTGENTYETMRALDAIIRGFDGIAERIDGSEIEMKQLPDLLMGSTLFANKRLVVIRGLSENKSVWNDLVDWLPRVSDDVHLVLVEIKPDKRTKTYKELKNIAEVREFAAWTDRDIQKAEVWLANEAKDRSITMDKKCIQLIVQRAGTDQWQLHQALEKLAVLDTVTPEIIQDLIEAQPSENVFNLFDAALRGQPQTVSDMIKSLELTEDPYMVFGLLSSQAFQLGALAVASEDENVAKDIGAHPFALSKLTPHARRLGRVGARKVIVIFAECDDAMKTSAADPWLLIERSLIKIAVR